MTHSGTTRQHARHSIRSYLTHNWLTRKLVENKVHPRIAELNGTVIDLGCGSRPYETRIAEHVDYYFGIDWGHSLHQLNADVIADLTKPLPILDAAVDGVVAFEVVEHLPDPGRTLVEVHRILRSRGVLMMTSPFQWWVHEAPWDYQRFTRYGLEHLLHSCGFVDVEVGATSGFWAMWILKLNYQLARLVRGSRMTSTLARLVLTPFWFIGQHFAVWADSTWPDERETVGYFVFARKP